MAGNKKLDLQKKIRARNM